MEEFSDEERARLQKAFGYTYEEYRKSILEMALNGSEGAARHGVDTAGCASTAPSLFELFQMDINRQSIAFQQRHSFSAVYVGKTATF